MNTSYNSNIWKLYIFQFFVSMNFTIAVLVPFFTDWGGLNFTKIMILQSWFMLWILLLEIPTGTIADYFGRKVSLLFACLVFIAGALVYASIPNFYMFLVGEFLMALSVTLFSGANDALVYDTLVKLKKTRESKEMFVKMQSLSRIGLVVGAPIGSIIAAVFGLRETMLMTVVPITIAFFIALGFKEPKIAGKKEEKHYFLTLKQGVKFFFKHKILKILAADMILINCIAHFMVWLYQPMLSQAGVGIAYFGIVGSVFILSQIAVMNNYGRLEKLLKSKKRLLFATSAITGAMFIAGGLSSYLPIVLMAIFIGGGFGMSRQPLFTSYMNKYIASSQRATVLSTISMIESFALVIFNLVVGVLMDWSLNYTLIILGSLALVFSLISKVEEEHLID